MNQEIFILKSFFIINNYFIYLFKKQLENVKKKLKLNGHKKHNNSILDRID